MSTPPDSAPVGLADRLELTGAGPAGFFGSTPRNARCEEWLADYLGDSKPQRLLVDELHAVLRSHPPIAEDTELCRFLIARAHKNVRGRKLAPETVAIREAILGLTDVHEQMTVRGIFYALTTQGVVPKTEIGGYKPVQTQVLELRREGFLPWELVANGTRWRREPDTWDSTEDALRETARLYRRNLWRSQGVRLEIWLEKDALASLVSRVTYEFGVALMVSRGQASDTYCYGSAQEAKQAWQDAEVETIIYALYDSDKSGRVAAEKIEEKLRRYSDNTPITCHLLAVTDEQIEDWNLPTRPAKEKGEPDAVELDAIPPDKMIALVNDAIVSHIDADAWNKELEVEKSEREILERISETARAAE